MAVEWYAGTRGYPEEGCACLAVGISTGHVQLMSGHRDPSPIELDTGLRLQHLRWSPTGDVLLVAGGLKAPVRERGGHGIHCHSFALLQSMSASHTHVLFHTHVLPPCPPGHVPRVP